MFDSCTWATFEISAAFENGNKSALQFNSLGGIDLEVFQCLKQINMAGGGAGFS